MPSQTSAQPSAARRGTVAAAAPHVLDLMLMDGALEHIAQARGSIEDGEDLEKHQLLTAAVQIVGELRSSLDVHGGGPFAVNLDDLCDYMSRQLVAANLQNRVATLDEVSHLLREVRTAWVMMPLEARITRADAIRK
jgi:flagellar secretion chaperone FliS